MKTPSRGLHLPLFLALFVAVALFNVRGPEASPLDDDLSLTICVSRVLEANSAAQQDMDAEAEFVRRWLDEEADMGLDLSDPLAILGLVSVRYPDATLTSDVPAYVYVWDEEAEQWLRICQGTKTIVLNGIGITNPVTISIQETMDLS